jgi:hypothetical protein
MSRTTKTDSRTDLPDASGRIPNSLRTPDPSRRYSYGVIAIVAAVVVITTLTLRHEYRKQLVYWQERLTRIADANQHLLKNWVRERRDDAQLVAAFQCDEIAARSGPGSHPLLWRLHNELNSVAQTYSYAGAYVLGRNGQILAQSDASPSLATSLLKEVVRNLQTGSAARAITIPAAEGRAGYPEVAFVAPVRQSGPASPKADRVSLPIFTLKEF